MIYLILVYWHNGMEKRYHFHFLHIFLICASNRVVDAADLFFYSAFNQVTISVFVNNALNYHIYDI